VVAKVTGGGGGARVVYMGTKPEPATTRLHAKYRRFDQGILALATALAREGAGSCAGLHIGL
jgi:hypothetical protein